MSNIVINNIVKLIDERRLQVLEANGLAADEENSNNIQYAWINGIYDDLIECIENAS